MRGLRRASRHDPFASFNPYWSIHDSGTGIARNRSGVVCHGDELHRVIERSGGYLLVVKWHTVEDHMVHFRQSDDFQAWRQLAGPFFKSPPQIVHTEVAVK